MVSNDFLLQIAGFISICIFVFTLFVLIKVATKIKFGALNFIAVFGFLVCSALLLQYFFGNFGLLPDGKYYHTQALQVLANWHGGETAELAPLKEVWPVFIAIIYLAFGVTPIAVVLFNALVLSTTALIIFLTLNQLGLSSSNKKITVLAVLISPFMIPFGLSLGRESLFWLGTSIVVLGTVRILKKLDAVNVLVFLLGLLIAIAIRPPLGIPMAYAFVFPTLVSLFIRNREIGTKLVISLSAIGIIASALIPSAINFIQLSNEKVNYSRIALSVTADSGFIPEKTSTGSPLTPTEELNSNNDDEVSKPAIVNAAESALSTFPNVLVGPFPWEYKSGFLWVFIGINSVYWVCTLVLAIAGIINGHKRLIGMTLLISSMLLTLVFASILTNYGIVIRFRAVSILILLPYSLSYLASAFSSRGKPRTRYINNYNE